MTLALIQPGLKPVQVSSAPIRITCVLHLTAPSCSFLLPTPQGCKEGRAFSAAPRWQSGVQHGEGCGSLPSTQELWADGTFEETEAEGARHRCAGRVLMQMGRLSVTQLRVS